MKDFIFKEDNILSIWQNEFYNEIHLALYSIVNKYLWTGKIVISETILEQLKTNRKDFEIFLIKYINELINILYKKKRNSIILYRGETRENFDIKVNDVLIYNNFHSTCDNISFALGFSEMYVKPNKSNQNIIMVFELPDGSHYKKLSKTLIHYNKKYDVTYYIDEFEYLIPPNCYYRVTAIYDLPRQIKIVKAKLILQERFNLVNNIIYTNKEIKYEELDDFEDESTENFIYEFERYDKMIEVLNRMEKYHIDDDIYYILSNNEKLFTIDFENIKQIASTTTIENYKDNLKILQKLGLHTWNKKLNDELESYVKGIQYFGFYNLDNFKRISNFKLYMGIENVTNSLKEPKFIEKIKNNKTGTIDKILYCEIAPDCYLYNCPYNDYKPNIQIQKDKIKITQYTKYIIEFMLFDVKIAISDNIKWRYDTTVLLIPNYKYNLRNIVKNRNKFEEPIEIIQIDLIGI